jgi:hypothetical protein
MALPYPICSDQPLGNIQIDSHANESVVIMKQLNEKWPENVIRDLGEQDSKAGPLHQSEHGVFTGGYPNAAGPKTDSA